MLWEGTLLARRGALLVNSVRLFVQLRYEPKYKINEASIHFKWKSYSHSHVRVHERWFASTATCMSWSDQVEALDYRLSLLKLRQERMEAGGPQDMTSIWLNVSTVASVRRRVLLMLLLRWVQVHQTNQWLLCLSRSIWVYFLHINNILYFRDPTLSILQRHTKSCCITKKNY